MQNEISRLETLFIPLNDKKKSLIIDKDQNQHEFILSSHLNCTLCSFNLNSATKAIKIVSHPILSVPLCLLCFDEYETRRSNESEDENEVCTWCYQGGNLFVCDRECQNYFCNECILRNLGQDLFNKIQHDDHWICLVCRPSPYLDSFKTALELGIQYSIYQESYFETQNLKTKDNADEIISSLTETQLTKELDILSLIIDEIDTANKNLEEDELFAVRKNIQNEIKLIYPTKSAEW